MIVPKEISIEEVTNVKISCLKENNEMFLSEIDRRFPGMLGPYSKELEAWSPGEKLFNADDKILFFCLGSDVEGSQAIADELPFAMKAGWLTFVVFEDEDGEFIWMTRDMYIEIFNENQKKVSEVTND